MKLIVFNYRPFTVVFIEFYLFSRCNSIHHQWLLGVKLAHFFCTFRALHMKYSPNERAQKCKIFANVKESL